MTGQGPGSPQSETDRGRPSAIRRVLDALPHAFGRGRQPPETMGDRPISSFEEAERAAFRSSTAATPGAFAGSAVATGSVNDRPPTLMGDPLARFPAKPEAIRATVARSESIPAASPPSAEPIPDPTPADNAGTRTRRQPGETAPESLLRAPSGAVSVADDFFDGLVRRVEGDR